MTSSVDVRGRIAVVPARGGSKRIPRKNIIDFHGKPMICWPLDMLLSSGRFEAVLVSTDDDEIARVASESGSVDIIKRPGELAGDEVPTAPVIVHAVEEFQRRSGSEVQVATVLYPTSVFATSEHLARADQLLGASGAQLVMSVCRYVAPIERAWRRDANGLIHRIDAGSALLRTQDLPDAFFDAAQFYSARPDTWSLLRTGVQVPTSGVKLEPSRVWDIDSPEDLKIARLLFGARYRS